MTENQVPERAPRLETRACASCGSNFRCYTASLRTTCTRCERQAAKARRDARYREALRRWRGEVIPVDESDVRPDDTKPESAKVMLAWALLAATLKGAP